MVEKISGIYRIVCINNGRYCYGSSKDIWKRWKDHLSALRRQIHCNPIVQRSFNKHGEDAFRIELVEEVSEEKLLEAENGYLKEHVGKSNCMNIAESATSPGLMNKGKKASADTKQKMSDGRRGSDNPFFGRKHSTKTKKKMSERWEYEKHFTEETCEKLSEATTRQWSDPKERQKQSERLKAYHAKKRKKQQIERSKKIV